MPGFNIGDITGISGVVVGRGMGRRRHAFLLPGYRSFAMLIAYIQGAPLVGGGGARAHCACPYLAKALSWPRDLHNQ